MTHADIINMWPSVADFSEDLGVAYGTAKAMRRRNRIPPEYWCRLVAKAADRQLPLVTLDALANAVAVEPAA